MNLSDSPEPCVANPAPFHAAERVLDAIYRPGRIRGAAAKAWDATAAARAACDTCPVRDACAADTPHGDRDTGYTGVWAGVPLHHGKPIPRPRKDPRA